MKTTSILVAVVLAATLPACNGDPFFETEGPAAPPLKEQLQSDEEGCPSCRPSSGGGEMEKEQLQEQDEADWDCPECVALPPDGETPPGLLKEQLQNESDRTLCEGCEP